MTIGLWLGEKAKIRQFSLSVTWVLFIGIALASLGVKIDHSVAQFAKDFGLILFVYSIGLQVGPSFSPFKKGVLRLNMLAAATVLLACVCTIVLHYVTGINMSTLAGVMSGATTSTPSLGRLPLVTGYQRECRSPKDDCLAVSGRGFQGTRRNLYGFLCTNRAT